MGKWESGSSHAGLGSLGAPGYLCVTGEGSRTVRQEVGERRQRPRVQEPHHLQREWNSKWGGLFLQKVEFRYGYRREGRSCTEREEADQVSMTSSGSRLLQTTPHPSPHITQRPKFKPPTPEQ
uniref:Uncharacterized protein n=1 Tax=Myotis myotis TaxID=51298 RepID=A0A7J7XHE5_MYOMY|nr:hypothetical protein mMyoMyo1_011659 [Myotis myotis]